MPLPTSSLTKMTFTATSGTSPTVIGTQTIPLSSLSLGANTVQITPGSNILTALQSGATVNPSLNLEYANGFPVVSTAGIPYPPPPVMLDTNGVTLKYTPSSIPLGSPNPYIVNVSGTYYAIMSNGISSINMIKTYAANFSQPITNPYVSPFVANGTKIPFNQIVTTLMTDMGSMFESNYNFNEPIDSWDTSNVTNMFLMFYTARAFNRDISKWNVTSVQPKPPTLFSEGSGLTNALLPLAFRV